jgi:hypothetical protein
LSGLIHGNVESGDNLYVNEDEPISILTSADFISNYLDDNTSHSIFLAENNEVKDSSALTDVNNDLNSSFSDEHGYLPGLGTHRTHLPTEDVNNDLNSSFSDEHGYLPGLGTHRTSLPTEDVNSANEATREDQRSVQERNVENLTSNSQPVNTTVSTRPEEEGHNIQQTRTAENSAVQPLTSDSNAGFVATAISPSPNDALSSDTRPFNPFSLKNQAESSSFDYNPSEGLNSLPSGSNVEKEKQSNSCLKKEVFTDQTDSTTLNKRVTFNTKAEVVTYNNSVKGWDPYFDPNSERDQTLTKTEDGLGPINKSTPESRAKALDIIASFAASTSSQTLDNQPLASTSSKTLDNQPVASTSSQTLDNQPVASTSSQTLDNQPVASSQDSVNNNLTDSEIYSAVLVLKK